MPQEKTITIIGAGAVGSAIAWELSQHEGVEVLVLERNDTLLGENQSSRNSGVVHAGVYYPQTEEPLKARLCVEGNRLLYDFCEGHGVPYKKCGKLVVATDPREAVYLDQVLRIAKENGVPGIRQVSGAEVKEYEPNVKAAAGLLVPSSGIVEATRLVGKLQTLAKNNGVMFMPGNQVTGIAAEADPFILTARSKDYTESIDSDIIINAAGLYADEVARMLDPACPHKIEPVRGESARFYRNATAAMNMKGMNVYPAPYGFYNDTGEKARAPWEEYQGLLAAGKVTPTVGVHLTPTFDQAGDEYVVGNTVTIGPLKTVGRGKEDYGRELKAPDRYLDYVQGFFPGLSKEAIQLHQAGIMAVLKTGRDFVIEADPRYPGCLNLIGIDSPGLTSCLAIARYVIDKLPL